MNTKLHKRELVVGLCMLSVSVCAFYFANRLPDSRMFTIGGTGLLPYITTFAMTCFSVLKCLSAFLGSQEQTGVSTEKLNIIRSIAAIILVAVYAVFIESVGFLICSTVLLFLVLPLFSFRRLKVGFAFALLASLVTWFLFSKVFSSYLPTGTLF